MLRIIYVRQILSNSIKKGVRINVARCLGSEVVRRKHYNKLLSPNPRKLAIQQWGVQLRHYASLPPHIKVNLPALSPTMEVGTIVSWNKKEGDKLEEGDLLCEIETDKATMGFETPETGYLAKILIPQGAKGVPIGKLLCIIVEEQSAVAAFKDFKDDGSSDMAPPKKAAAAPAPAPAPAAAAAPARPAAAPAAAPARPAAAPAAGRVYASPMARRLAELQKIRLGGVPSGMYGSLKAGDLSADPAGRAAPATASAPTPAPAPGAAFVDIPLSGMRETIAKRLALSKQTIPHYQLAMTVNVDKTLDVRKRVNEKLAKEIPPIKVSLNDFIIKAVASTCKRVPEVNSYWMDTHIRQFSNVDVSVAVATPTGLITPIIFSADHRGIIDISKSMKQLAVKAKEGKLQPHEYQGGTVSISNLGMYGITMFNAILNPPQSFILAVGGLQEHVVEGEDGFRKARFITFTASADHRVIDGAVAAQWMKIFRESLEDPTNIIM